eukprot:scaffold654_cov207-Ochromonas_danica.AAC.16
MEICFGEVFLGVVYSRKCFFSPHNGGISYQRELSQLSESGEETSSPIVDLEGYRWSVSIYPGGDREESKGYLSCFLNSQSQAAIKVFYSRSVGKDRTCEEIKTFNPYHSWGYDKFISLANLKKPSNGYYNDDAAIVIRVDIHKYGDLVKQVPNAPWTDTHIVNNSLTTLKNDLSSMLFNPLLSDITIHVGEERQTPSSSLCLGIEIRSLPSHVLIQHDRSN